jgi:hypothetical protein
MVRLGYNLSAHEESMSGFFEGLPWKLSALGSLVVLAVGFFADLDPWIALQRAGIAFAAFWVVGLIGRQFFSSSASTHGLPDKKVRMAPKDHGGPE